MPIEILGSPKTVRLEGQYKGETFSAPMEVWIMAIVAMFDESQKQQFFTLLKLVQQNGEWQKIQRAAVVADIQMPPLL